MKRKFALFVSFIFHPIVFAFFLPIFVIYRQSGNIVDGIVWMGFSVLFLIFGLVVFFLMRPIDVITDFDLSKKEKRPIFYATALLFAVLYFIISILFKGIFYPLSIVALGVILGIGIFELVNFYIKASIHLGIVCAFIIMIGILYGFVVVLSIFWIPFLVGWARVYLHKHTRAEITTGGAIGSIVTLATFAIARILMYNR